MLLFWPYKTFLICIYYTRIVFHYNTNSACFTVVLTFVLYFILGVTQLFRNYNQQYKGNINLKRLQYRKMVEAENVYDV